MSIKGFYALALLPLLCISEGCATRNVRENLMFPFRERDIPRVTSFQVVCEGGKCDEKYIARNVRNLERHFQIVYAVLDAASHKRPPFFLKIHVVPLHKMRQLLNEDPSRDNAPSILMPQGIIARSELYVQDFAPKKNDPALNLALEAYIRGVHLLADNAPLAQEEFARIKREVVVRGRYTVDASFFNK